MTTTKNSFYRLYEKYKHLMFSVAMDVLNDNYCAEDAVQNAFMKIIDRMDQIDNLDSNQTQQLIITITKNTAIDLYRKRMLQWSRETGLEEASDTPQAISTATTVNNFLTTIEKLPEKYKDVLLLKYALDLSNSEIAEIIGISEVNVRKRLSRARRQLEVIVEKEGLS